MKKFEHFSVYIECSSGVAPTVETVKRYIDIFSQMGYDRLYLGEADAYKIKEEPYFNYKRGGYTKEDFNEMDRYAIEHGMELVAQIHTLSHLHFLKKYPEYFNMFDTDHILMVGEERTYELVEHMIKAISEGLSTRRIHLGLDEAFGLGTGTYLKKYGPADKKELLLKHLTRVLQILKKYGYTCEMWGDMLMETDNTTVTAEDVRKCLPDNAVVYAWNYEENDEGKLAQMIDSAKAHCPNIGYAGGVWKYLGFGPNNGYSISRILPQMKVCYEKGVPNYMITLWSDQVSPCSVYSTLPTLFAAAEYAYGNYDGVGELDKEKFYRITGISYDDLYSLEYISDPFKKNSRCRSSSSFWVFYTDLLMGNFDTLIPDGAELAYRVRAEEYARLENGKFGHVFKMSAAVMRTLALKAPLPKRIREAYAKKDKEAAKRLIEDVRALKASIEEFIVVFDEYFMHDNISFGVDFHHLYNGGQVARCDYAIRRLTAFIEKDEKIAELEGGILPLGYNPPPTLDSSVMVDYRMLISYCIQ